MKSTLLDDLRKAGLPGHAEARRCPSTANPSRHNVGRPPFAQDRGRNRARLVNREDDDRDAVVAGKREGRSVHDLQVPRDRFVMAQAIEACRGWILLRVGGIDAVNLSGLHHRIAGEFGGPKRCAGVGGEERIARSRRRG